MTVRVTYLKNDDTSWVEIDGIDDVEIKDNFIFLKSKDKIIMCFNSDKVIYYSCK